MGWIRKPLGDNPTDQKARIRSESVFVSIAFLCQFNDIALEEINHICFGHATPGSVSVKIPQGTIIHALPKRSAFNENESRLPWSELFFRSGNIGLTRL